MYNNYRGEALFNIPNLKRSNFKRHFIKNASLEIRYSSSHEIVWDDFKSRLLKVLPLGRLDQVQEIFDISVDLGAPPQKEVPASVTTKHTLMGIRLHSKDEGLGINILSDRMIFSTPKYTSFEDFWSDFVKAYEKIEEICQPEINWLGIRKINNVTVIPEDGIYRGDGVSSSFFTPVRDGSFLNEALVQGENRYSLKQDTVRANISTRFSKSSTPSGYDILIDIDINTSKAIKSKKELQASSEELNSKVYDLFCWITSNDLLTEMNS